jgi:hypothetical protein
MIFHKIYKLLLFSGCKDRYFFSLYKKKCVFSAIQSKIFSTHYFISTLAKGNPRLIRRFCFRRIFD